MPDDVPADVKTSRFLELERVVKESQAKSLEALVGRTLSVLAERVSSRSDAVLTGHSTCHRVVNFEGEGATLGKVVAVVVTERKSNSLYGRVA